MSWIAVVVPLLAAQAPPPTAVADTGAPVAVAPAAVAPAAVAPTVPVAAGPIRVYLAPMTAGADTSPAVVSLIQDRLLVASRRHSAQYAVLGASDMQRLLDVNAAQQAIDCNVESCMSDVADALGAPQLITGQLGRIGDTWLFTLTRIDRKTMEPVTRVSRETRGSSPEGLLSQLEGAMDEVLQVPAPPAKPISPLVWAGVGTAVAGAAIGGLGVVGLVLSHDEFNRNQENGLYKPVNPETDPAKWSTISALSVAGMIVGGGALVGGIGLMTVGFLADGE
jgi:hypothetical protein